MRKLILSFTLLLCFFCACENEQKLEKVQSSKLNNSQPVTKRKGKDEASYEVNTYQTSNGWGYRIVQGGKLLIDQPTIPGRAGVQGFGTELDARNVANLVCNKLKAKIFPPTVSEDDLKNLNIH